MLISDQNTPEAENKIHFAANRFVGENGFEVEDNKVFTIYEHGQWWIRFYDLSEEIDRTFSVIDAEGAGTYDGFAFEEV